ncbi:AAA domain-containing protein [Paracrocinitomix mangrovi]|uniref:DEAD/DEAH box helicase n=1 Tax=Paracrocinitomix mangrovi TaxID=2862509 RepID=UPI001C8EF781|nr:AAA domain-containing protein [Paracrocinitomix mangrovi]UKN00087.1 AAA domain-containing protein [Paracrocinitomix mangrovi]
MKWKSPQKEQFFISPLLYKPASIVAERKIETTYRIDTNEEDPYFVNPILIHSFKQFYDIQFPDYVEDKSVIPSIIKEQLSVDKHAVVFKPEIDDIEEWQYIECEAIGNFNYKKSSLGKDFEIISKKQNPTVTQLLEGNEIQIEHNNKLYPIIPLDFSQQAAILSATSNNLVIQGPPGTGKSHTIVGLIGHYLSLGKKVLFVSQKKSALEVVYDRLQSLGLDRMTAFLNTEKDEKKSFFSDLKTDWDKLTTPSENKQINTVQPTSSLLQFYLNQYQKEEVEFGGSIHQKILYLINSGYKKDDLGFIGSCPNYNDWFKHKSFLAEFEQTVCSNSNIHSLSDAGFIVLNKAVFSEKDPIDKLAKRLDEIQQTLDHLQEVKLKFQLDVEIKPLTHLALAASILNMVNKTQLDLLNKDSKSYQKFANAAKKYVLLKSKVERAQNATKNWKTKPTKVEITELIDLIKHQHAPKGIFGILKRKNERIRNAFLAFDSNLSDIAKLQLLEELRNEYNLQAEFEEHCIKLKHDFNINEPATEIKQILSLRSKLDEISENAYISILEHEDSFNLIEELSSLHPKIQHFLHLYKFIVEDNINLTFEVVEQLIKQIKGELNQLRNLSIELQRYFMLSVEVRNFIAANNLTIDKLSAIVTHQALIQQKRFYPIFEMLNGDSLVKEISKYNEDIAEVFSNNIEALKISQQQKIFEKEKLIATPASKLNENQKERKKILKAERKILIHEASKKQRHISLKQFTTECWEYIKDIYPIWMMNPLAVSERLNCENAIFDVVIFDESSQIPLEDAIPSAYRAKQVIVVGDDKQMPPGSFFTSNSSSETLLTKADVAFKNVMLKWHYRSNHPALIDFSNRYFYDNELLTLPPNTEEIPIEFIKVDGKFIDRKNQAEADGIARWINNHSSIKYSDIAVVSFSREQQQLIEKTIAKKCKGNVEELLVRNLENVQGIEREVVLISLGYAKDEDGNFRLHFGPINQESGGNRLNVLITRAKDKLVFFSSVDPDDFGLPENIGVSYLKDYLQYAQEVALGEATKTSFNNAISKAKVNYEKGEISLTDPCTLIEESKDLSTIISVLSTKFKKVKIELSVEKWR